MLLFSSVRGDIDAYRSLSLTCLSGEVSLSGGHCDHLGGLLSCEGLGWLQSDVWSPKLIFSRGCPVPCCLTLFGLRLRSFIASSSVRRAVKMTAAVLCLCLPSQSSTACGFCILLRYRRWLVYKCVSLLVFVLYSSRRSLLMPSSPVCLLVMVPVWGSWSP